MGIADSKLASDQTRLVDDITTVSSVRTAELDLLLQKLKALEIATPLLESPPAEVGLKDVLLRHAYGSEHGSLDPTSTASLLTLYQEWQRVTCDKIRKNQEDLSDKIDVVEALAVKLLQRFHSSLQMMKDGTRNLEDVCAVKAELEEMKKSLDGVLGDYNALEKRINAEGPPFLENILKPLQHGGILAQLEPAQ